MNNKTVDENYYLDIKPVSEEEKVFEKLEEKKAVRENEEFPNPYLKVEVNTLVWMFAHPDMRLADAEDLAVKIYDLILESAPKQ